MRNLGWIVVAGLAAWAALAGWLSAPAVRAELPSADRNLLQSLPDEALPGWLASYAARLNSTAPHPVQAFIVLSIPDQPPMVVASMPEVGDAQFPAPWPSVKSALASPHHEPFNVSGSYSEREYTHQLFPLDDAGARYLLVNASAEPPSWFGLRGLCALLAILLVVGLVSSNSPA